MTGSSQHCSGSERNLLTSLAHEVQVATVRLGGALLVAVLPQVVGVRFGHRRDGRKHSSVQRETSGGGRRRVGHE